MYRVTTSVTYALAMSIFPFTGLAISGGEESYPSKPIRLIVPFPPGGPSDYSARTIGQPLSKSLGQPFVIDNRPGADGAIAARAALAANPDGYTLLFSGASMVPLSLANKPLVDVLVDFAPISKVTRFEWAMYVTPHIAANTVAEFVAHAQMNPNKLNYASSNLSEYLATAQFLKATGTSIVRVPYKGGSQVVPDLVAGRVQLNFAPISVGLAYAKEGRLRILATVTKERSRFTPDIPSMVEAGVPGISVPAWQALFAPAKTPKAIIETLNRKLQTILQMPEVRGQFERRAMQPQGSTATALRDTIEQDLRVWRIFVQEDRVTLQ
ncbi:MAG: tripartite tricarboxylate transporter substrate-binding protein [Betaproteobacteria bacterium]